MGSYSIIVNGITNHSNIPEKFKSLPNTTISEKNILDLSEESSTINKILNLDIKLTINSVSKNLDANDLIIVGYKKITVDYMTGTFSNDIKNLDFKLPFIAQINYEDLNFNVNKVYAAVTELKVKLLYSKCLCVQTSIFLAPLLKHKPKPLVNNDTPNYINKDNSKDEIADIVLEYDMNSQNDFL